MKLSACTSLLLCASVSSVMATHVTKCSGIIIKLCPEGYKQEWRGGLNPLSFDCYCERPETPAEIAIIEKTDKCSKVTQKCIAFDSYKTTDEDNSCSQIYDYCEKEEIDTICSALKDRKTNWQCVEDYGSTFNSDEEDYDDYYGINNLYGDEDEYDYGSGSYDYEGGDDEYEGGDDDYEYGDSDDQEVSFGDKAYAPDVYDRGIGFGLKPHINYPL